MNIIISITANSRAAVDRFSPTMRARMTTDRISTHLKALRAAPFSVCSTLYICAVASTMVPLAISEG